MMGSHRCSTCALNYRSSGKCRVCGGDLSFVAFQSPDDDLEDKIASMTTEEAQKADITYGWRMEQMVLAGAPMWLAKRLAKDPTVDLHRAVSVLRNSPIAAERILL